MPWYTAPTVTLVNDHRGRFLFVDGLRGLAALAVVGPHAVSILATGDPGWLSRVLMTIAPYGAYGVEVFFVISGFAIARSLLDATPRSFSIGQFVLRRAVRLDPPYWIALLLVGALNFLRAKANHRLVELPAAGQALAHILYLQDLLGYPQFNVVFWTLCLEFQLYITFACLTSAFLRLEAADAAPRIEGPVSRPALVLVFLFALSVLASAAYGPLQRNRWCIPFIYLFLAGVLAAWREAGRISNATFLGCAIVMTLALVWDPTPARVFGVLATLLVSAAGQMGKLDQWLRAPIFQWLGRLSYSIYLVHVPIAVLALGLRSHLAPASNLVSLVAFGAVYVLSVAFGYCLHVTVEAPCLRMSKRLKQKSSSVVEVFERGQGGDARKHAR